MQELEKLKKTFISHFLESCVLHVLASYVFITAELTKEVIQFHMLHTDNKNYTGFHKCFTKSPIFLGSRKQCCVDILKGKQQTALRYFTTLVPCIRMLYHNDNNTIIKSYLPIKQRSDGPLSMFTTENNMATRALI